MRRLAALLLVFALCSGGCAARTWESDPPDADARCAFAYRSGVTAATDMAVATVGRLPATPPASIVERFYPNGGEEARCFQHGFADYAEWENRPAITKMLEASGMLFLPSLAVLLLIALAGGEVSWD